MGSPPSDEMEGPYSARLPSDTAGEKSRSAVAGRRTADGRHSCRSITSGAKTGPSSVRLLNRQGGEKS